MRSLDATQSRWYAEDEQIQAGSHQRHYFRIPVIPFIPVIFGLPAASGEDHDVAGDGNWSAPPYQYVRLLWAGRVEALPGIGVGGQQFELLSCAQIARCAVAHSVFGEGEFIL